jgi:surface antigen
MVMVAPTVSKAKIDAKYLEMVGYIDGTGITLKMPERLAEWLAQSDALDTAPSGSVVLWGKK